MDVLTKKQQRQLLTAKGINRLTRGQLASEIGVSLPTMSKLINAPAPLAVQEAVYKRLVKWLDSTAVATGDKEN